MAPDGANTPFFLRGQLNEHQRQAFDMVKRHHEGTDVSALRMLVFGTAGTGKSWLAYALFNLLGGHARPAAPTGMVTFLIGGSTLHGLLRLPVRGGKAPQGDGLTNLETRPREGKRIIIDEISMVIQVKMAWMDRRLRHATGKTAKPFGGLSIAITRDPGRLPPVGGRSLHALESKDQLNQEGFQAYRQFTGVLILQNVQRQGAAGAE